MKITQYSIILVILFDLLFFVACRKIEPPDDEGLVDASRSTFHVENRSCVGAPGVLNRITAILVDHDGKKITTRAPVRIGCRGASQAGKTEILSTGVYFFSIEPRPDASAAICSITVGSRIMPQAIHFDIIEPCAQPSPDVESADARKLAMRYAPVFYQDAGRVPRADYFASIDFDGNLDPLDNRMHIDSFPLPAVVYFSVVETATHAFIVYAVFHPINYGLFADDTSETLENDMTGLMVVADKAHPKWPPVIVETYMEGRFLPYASRTEIRPGTERVAGDIRFEDATHPRVFIEAGRHGCLISSDLVLGEYTGEPGQDFPGSDGIVYRLADNQKEPDGPNDRNAGYRLMPILDTLWKLRGFVGKRSVFSSYFKMDNGCVYPERFVSSRPNRRGGHPPWAWDDVDDEGIRIGEWLLWPAKVIGSHLTMPQPFDLEYTYNPYLGLEAPVNR